MMDTDAIRRFLQIIFSVRRPDEYIQISIHYPGHHQGPIPGGNQWFKELDEAVEFVATRGRTRHCYYGICPRVTNSGKADAIKRVPWLWADVDLDPDKAADLLQELLLPPTIIIRSGNGLQALWRVEDDTDVERGNQANQKITTFLKLEPTWSAERLFRIPGTFNVKNPEDPRPARIHDLSLQYTYGVTDMFGALTIRPRFRRMAVKGWVDPKWEGDRSKRDIAVVGEALRQGMSRRSILAFWQALPMSDKLREEGRNAENYVRRTFEEAEANLKLERGASDIFDTRDDGWYYAGQRLSTFTFDPAMIVEDPKSGDSIIGTVYASGRSWPDQTFPRSAFVKTDNFQKALHSLHWQWYGSNKLLNRLQMFLLSRAEATGCPTVVGIRSTGWYPGFFISENQILTRQGIVPPEHTEFYLLDKGKQPYASTDWTDHLEPGLVGKIHTLLMRLNQPGTLLPVLGWYMGAPFHDPLLGIDVRWPILNVFGTHGSGKTETLQKVMNRLLGLSEKSAAPIEASTTNFSVLDALSISNAFPAWFDEYRATNILAVRFLGYLRSAYGSGTDRKGRQDLSVREFKLTAPVVVSGEDALDDPALQERSVRVRFSKPYLQEHPEAIAAFNALADERAGLPLVQFGSAYLRFVLDQIETGRIAPVYDEAWALVQATFPAFIPIRVRDNIVAATFGLLMYEGFLVENKVEFRVTQELVEEAFSPMLEATLGDRNRTDLEIDDFVTDVITTFIEAGHKGGTPKFSCLYDKEENILWFHLDSAMKWWIRERHSQRLKVLSPRAFKAQLSEREGEYYAGAKVKYLTGVGAMRMHGVSLRKATEIGLDVPPDLSHLTIQNMQFMWSTEN